MTRTARRRRSVFLVLSAGLLGAGMLAGCGSTRQIETAPPTAATPEAAPEATPTVPLAVTLETGRTPLPAEVASLRFRVREVRLREAGGAWHAFPAEAGLFELGPDARTRKPILTARVPEAAYDSLALVLHDVFVRYDANSGGPLAHPAETPTLLPVDLRTVPGAAAALRLRFEPGASLARSDDCRWSFLPFIIPVEAAGD